MTAGAIEAAYDELARRVDDLRGFEREYRARLEAWITSQLRELREPGITGPVQVGRDWTDAGPGIRLRVVRHGDVSEPGAVWIEVETP